MTFIHATTPTGLHISFDDVHLTKTPHGYAGYRTGPNNVESIVTIVNDRYRDSALPYTLTITKINFS